MNSDEINAHQQKMWDAAATMLEAAKATFEPPRHNQTPQLTGEHLMAGSPFRIRIYRLRNGGTKMVILEHDWLKATKGRE